MGRYDGEDYPPEYYLQRSLDDQATKIGTLKSLVRQWVPHNDPVRKLYLLKELGTAHYGTFSWEEGIEALKKGGIEDTLGQLHVWVDQDLIWRTKKPPFREDLSEGLKLSHTAELYIELFDRSTVEA